MISSRHKQATQQSGTKQSLQYIKEQSTINRSSIENLSAQKNKQKMEQTRENNVKKPFHSKQSSNENQSSISSKNLNAMGLK